MPAVRRETAGARGISAGGPGRRRAEAKVCHTGARVVGAKMATDDNDDGDDDDGGDDDDTDDDDGDDDD